MRTYVAPAALLAVFLGACSDSTGSGGGYGYGSPSPTTAPPSTSAPATWTQVYTDIISPSCASCHSPTGIGGESGKLDMSSQPAAYTNLFDVAAAGSACSGKGTRVTPKSAATSILYLKISTTDPSPCGSKMPLTGPALSQAEVDEIASWINAGAMND